MFRKLRKKREQAAYGKRLTEAHPDQAARFAEAVQGFGATYQRLAGAPLEPYVTPTWEAFNRDIEHALLPRPSFRFLSDPVLRKTMFVRAGGAWMASQSDLIRAHIGAACFEAFVLEDAAGGPEIHDATLLTSHNRLHHASHLVHFEQATGVDLTALQTIVEWGGGYGGVARLLHRRLPHDPTYVIVDTPLFTCLQFAYLIAVLGPERVRIWDDAQAPEAGKVNLLPLGHVTRHAETLRCDLFLSTWALSESSAAAQDLVSERDWFGAAHLLIAFQDASALFPDAGRVGDLAKNKGAALAQVPYLDGNTYAFR